MNGIYQMPPDTNEREKIIGGILTMGQLLWIGGGVLIFVFILITLYRYLAFFSIILGFPFIVLGAIFALKKVKDMPLPTYLRYRRRYKKKNKYYVNDGNHSELSFSIDE